MANATLGKGLIGRDGTTGLWDQIAAMPRAELVRRYRFSVGHFDERVFDLADEQLDQAFLPEAGVGRWPVRVLLGHLADAEVVYVHRLRRAVAEPGAVLALWDEDAFIDSGLYAAAGEGPTTAPAPIGAFVASMYTLRQWTGEWLGSLSDEAWSRSVLHPEAGELSVHALAVRNVWHLEHHAAFLNAKVEKFLGPKPAAEGGCCGGTGGCGSGGGGGGCCNDKAPAGEANGKSGGCGCHG
jgi:hypothetical protein